MILEIECLGYRQRFGGVMDRLTELDGRIRWSFGHDDPPAHDLQWIAHLERENAALRAKLDRIAEMTGIAGVDTSIDVEECVAALRAERDALETEIKELANASIEINHKYSAELEVLRENVRNAIASGGVTYPALRMLEKAVEGKP